MFNAAHIGEQISGYLAGQSGSNLASNIAHFKTSLLVWHVFNEEIEVFRVT